jgi:hypothetical protein
MSLNPADFPRIGEDGSGITLDLNILLFTPGISILAGIMALLRRSGLLLRGRTL